MLEILEDYVDVFFNREKWDFKVILFSSNLWQAEPGRCHDANHPLYAPVESLLC